MVQQLRYIKGERILVHWKDTSPEFSVTFSPVGDKLIPEDLALRLLDNPKYKGQFEVIGNYDEQKPKTVEPVEKPKFKCDVCGKEASSKAGLGSHKRKHKEKQHEEVT